MLAETSGNLFLYVEFKVETVFEWKGEEMGAGYKVLYSWSAVDWESEKRNGGKGGRWSKEGSLGSLTPSAGNRVLLALGGQAQSSSAHLRGEGPAY